MVGNCLVSECLSEPPSKIVHDCVDRDVLAEELSMSLVSAWTGGGYGQD